ncbi:diacylglycerol/lipid kinase family protein [Nocardioides limicola]|uniref:diacylglycerol/lipid kinase family protein n=1 Tax=Nocardioides limicola TaxID=2803368 RepID=UPI00193C2CD8|nr:diacylglycerol kinase family protein [Nocardioides sp. DJM-14]
MRSFTFLVNPNSGGGAAPESVVPLTRRLRDAGAEVEVTYSPGPEAVPTLVGRAVGRGDVVVAVGGDGMLSSLAGEVAAAGGTLTIVPAGRGNDFARMLALPTEDEPLARLLLDGEVRPVDLVAATFGDQPTRIVAGSVYAGVDARAAAIVDTAHWLPGKLQYPYAAVRALATYRPHRVRVEVDGEGRDYQAAAVVVANSGYYGKGMHIAPDAVVDDGLLDVVVIEAASRRDLIRRLPKVYDGTHVQFEQVHVLRGRRVVLHTLDGLGMPTGGDGEPLGPVPGVGRPPLVVEVREAALNVIR